MDSTIDGVEGDWGPLTWGDAGGFDLPNGPQVQAKDVLTQTTVAAGQDNWTGTLKNLLTTTTGYLLQKDAIKSGLVARGANGQPVNVSGQPVVVQQQGLAGNTTTWIVVGVAVMGAILLATRSKG